MCKYYPLMNKGQETNIFVQSQRFLFVEIQIHMNASPKIVSSAFRP